MKRLDLDHWPPLISIAVLIICSGLLWAEYGTAGEGAHGETLGRVVEARGTLQRKASRAVIFQDTRRQGRLHSGDTLRTSHSSRAVIQLNSGIKITLGEFSMVQLTRSRDHLDLNLNQGSIRVRSGGRALRVKSDAGGVNLKQGELNLQRKSGSKLSIEVRKGSAELTAGGRTHVLKENQRAEIKGKRVGIQEISFVPTSPRDGAVLFTPEQRGTVRFSWEDKREGASAPTLEISESSDYKKILRFGTTASGEAKATLVPGAYYWRLRSGAGISESRFLLLRSLRAPRILKPAPGASFRRVAGPPRVDFAWIPGTGPADYTLEISNRADFKKLKHSLKCTTTGLSLNLEPGRYYWRVQSRLRVNAADSTGKRAPVVIASAANSFRVIASKSYARPVPLAPGPDAGVSAGTARGAGILFSWRGPGEVVRWEWSLAGDAAFSTRVQSAGADRAYALLKGPLKEGYSYWRVRGFDAKGRATPYSIPVRFRVVETPAITALSPREGARIAKPRILFRWKTGGTSSAYRFKLSRTRNMKKTVVSRMLYGKGLDLRTPAPGRYFWRVDIVRNGRMVTTGPVRAFTIPSPPDAPRVIFPAAGKTVDMSSRDRLDFRWRSVKNAFRYRLRLFQFKGGKKISVLNILTSRPAYSLRDLSKLDIGDFAWSVSALNQGGRESAAKLVRFRVELKNRPTIPRIKASGAELK